MTIALTPAGNTTRNIAAGIRMNWVEDAPTTRWVQRPAPEVTAADLLKNAQQDIAKLLNLRPGWDDDRAPSVDPVCAKITLTLIGIIANFDDAATPQIAPRRDGGLDSEWLVGGSHLALTVCNEGRRIEVWATTSAEDDPDLDYDLDFKTASRGDFITAIYEAGQFLRKISQHVRKRVGSQ